MNRKTYIMLDLAILLALLVGIFGLVDKTQVAGSYPQYKASDGNILSGKASIDPDIYATLDREGIARVLVILQQQADLSGAARLQAKVDKGAFVYHQLTAMAERTQGPLRAFLDSKGVEYRAYWIVNMIMVTADVILLDELARQPGVERIEMYAQSEVEPLGNDLGPDYVAEYGPIPPATTVTQTDPSLGEYGTESPATVEWNIQRVGADDVWGLGITGAGAVVGSMDTGVEWTHPALVDHYRPQIPGAPGRHDYNWFDGVGGSPAPIDYGYHGTITMGIIVGDDGAGNQIGMAPGAYWMACPGIGSPYVNPFDCYQWFLAPTDLNGNNPRPDLAPDVLNIARRSSADYHAAIQALYAAGIYFVQPAGNHGYAGCRTLNLYAGQWPEVTSTGAFQSGDIIWENSGRGPVQIGHEWFVKPDIAAPGVGVRTSIPYGGYASLNGTSLATPHVSGAVALLISGIPELRGRVDLLEMVLKTNAEPKLSTECPPFVGVPNAVWGWGILNAYNAVLAAQVLELGAVEGQVYESGTLDPVSAAHLSFGDATTGWAYVEKSDASGDYGHILPVGTYAITATHYGYLDSVINGVSISTSITTTQDIEMALAPIWNVSGVVSDSLTGEPLAAVIDFEGTPVSTETDPLTGAYSTEVAQGDWWLAVTSPGYAGEAIQIPLDQNRVENFSLDPVIYYYMRRSVDGECGAQFAWMDARPGGTSWPLGDSDYVQVGLPFGRTFTFYGNTYNAIYIGSDGIVTFGYGYRDYSVPIPNPASPNNGIYAFSTNLIPSIDPPYKIYTKYINNRYFVIEWYQVGHYPDQARDPETFEIILDLDSNRIKLQYMTVSDPTGVVIGVENSTGTEATQYAYDDPVLITGNTAVEFYPIYGSPPSTGGTGEMTGLVTDEVSGLPIEDALVTAVAYTTGETYNYTTDLTGTYSAQLCADWYNVMAEAPGYEPGTEVRASVYPAAQTTQNFTLNPVGLTEVTITGPVEGWVYTPYAFTAAVEPITTGLPVTYTWQATGQDTVIHTGGITDTVAFTWQSPGAQIITVTAANVVGSVMDTHAITITASFYPLYLPITLKEQQFGTPPPGVKAGTAGFFAALLSGGSGVSWWLRRKRY